MNHNKPIEIANNIYFIGAFDPDIRTFDIIMKTANGSSYNAYLIKTSEGVIIVDTVKLGFEKEFFSKIEQLCSYDEIKYVICHHLEPDHAGAIPELSIVNTFVIPYSLKCSAKSFPSASINSEST